MVATLETGVYYIQNVGTETVMDLAGGSNIDGTKVQGFQKRSLNDGMAPAQLWAICQVGENKYTIQNMLSRSFVDLANNQGANGTPILGWHYQGGPNQMWRIQPNANGNAYVIICDGSGTFANLANSGNNCDPVTGWAGKGVDTDNVFQLWRFLRA